MLRLLSEDSLARITRAHGEQSREGLEGTQCQILTSKPDTDNKRIVINLWNIPELRDHEYVACRLLREGNVMNFAILNPDKYNPEVTIHAAGTETASGKLRTKTTETVSYGAYNIPNLRKMRKTDAYENDTFNHKIVMASDHPMLLSVSGLEWGQDAAVELVNLGESEDGQWIIYGCEFPTN